MAEFAKLHVELSHTDTVIGSNRGQVWQVIVDGSSGELVAKAGVVLESSYGNKIS